MNLSYHAGTAVLAPQILEAIALTGEMTRVPLRLYDRGRRVQSILRSPDLKLRPLAGFVLRADGESSPFSPLALADELEPELTDLGLLVDTRFEDQRAQSIARRRRQRAVEEFDLGNAVGPMSVLVDRTGAPFELLSVFVDRLGALSGQ